MRVYKLQGFLEMGVSWELLIPVILCFWGLFSGGWGMILIEFVYLDYVAWIILFGAVLQLENRMLNAMAKATTVGKRSL